MFRLLEYDNDPIAALILRVASVYQSTWGERLVKCYMVICCLDIVLTVYGLITIVPYDLWADYLGYFLVMVHSLINAWMLYQNKDDINRYCNYARDQLVRCVALEETNRWPFRTKLAKWFERLTVTMLVYPVIILTVCIFIPIDKYGMLIVAKIVTDYTLPKPLVYLLCIAQYLLIVTMACPMFGFISLPFYMCWQGILQLDSLRVSIENIDMNLRDKHVSESQIYQSDDFQQTIQSRLIVVNYIVQGTKGYIQMMVDKISFMLSVNVVLGTLTALAFTYEIYVKEDPITTISILLVGADVALGVFLLFFVAQIMSDKMEEVNIELYQTRWYYWNKKNRIILMGLIHQCQQPFVVTFGYIFEGSYETLIKMTRVVWSGFRFLQDLSE